MDEEFLLGDFLFRHSVFTCIVDLTMEVEEESSLIILNFVILALVSLKLSLTF
jgi:hypothetical protein